MANNRELSQLASLIVVDDTTRNIGIATTGFSKVGIGTTNPITTLDVRGKTLLWNQPNVGYAVTKGDMDTYAVLKLRGHATDSTNMQFAHINNGNAMGVQVTNALNTANWDILLNPFGGNIGIGTTNPSQKLQVYGGSLNVFNPTGEVNAQVQSGDGTSVVAFRAINTNKNYRFGIQSSDQFVFRDATTSDNRLGITSTGEVIIGYNATPLVTTGTASQTLQVTGGAYVSGNTGIGTTNPRALLQVGAAITESIIVTSNGILGIGGTNVGSATNKLQIITEGVAAEGLGIFGTWTSQNAEQGAVNFYGAKDANAPLASIVCIDNRATAVASRSGSLVFKTAASSTLVEALRIDRSQRVGIGTTNPTSALHVVGDVLVTGITTSTDFNSSSDINLKDNIQRIENPIDKVLQLDGVTFNWKETNRPSVGVVAQQVEKVLPQLVSGDQTKTVNYNGLIALLIECVKEHQIEINNLKEKLK
jgi:hypothetical protein